jgi:hypothetical protein
MKHALLAALLLSCVSCGIEDISIEYRPVRTEVQVPSVNHDTGGELQYMVYCTDEDRALSGWENSRGAAESQAREYLSAHPDRAWTVLWRQKPGGRLIPKHPRG